MLLEPLPTFVGFFYFGPGGMETPSEAPCPEGIYFNSKVTALKSISYLKITGITGV